MSNPFPPLKPPQAASRTMSIDPKLPLAGLDVLKVGAILVGIALAWAALGQVWMGIRPQSQNLASDVGYSLDGNWKRGLDL